MKRHFYKNEKFVLLLFVLLSFLAFSPNKLMAQALKTDGAVPVLDACGASGTFTVTIAKGALACNAGTLQIGLPTTGFEYVAGSAKIGATTLAETNVTATGATLTLPAISAGVATDLVTITYQARANCEAIPLAILPDEQKPTVTYTLNGCTATAQTGQSDIININFAVLKVEVTPNASQGVIGSIITRTIKVTNNGNGSVSSFTIARSLGASLSLTSVTQPAGWTVDATDPNKYIYTGASLAPGASVNLSETVKINACTALQTTFEAYYGCVGKCELGNANGTVTAGISIDQSIQPKLQVTVNTTPAISCYNQEYEHVWTIKNNGTGVSSSTKLFMYIEGTTVYAGSYFNENSITVSGLPVTINPSDTKLILPTYGGFGTEGKIRELSVNIPDLAPGESREIRFKQYYAAPVADCTKDLSAFFRAYTAYSATYKHRDGCDASGTNPDIILPLVITNSAPHYEFNGTNVGEVDITSGYNADFAINSWDVNVTDISAGAYFDVLLQLSAAIQPGFDMTAIKLVDPLTNIFLSPVITNLGGGKYQLRINHGTPNWPNATGFNSSSYHLQFPVTLSCAAGTTAAYTVTGQLNLGGGCTTLVQFACQTVSLNAHCGTSCPDGGLDNGVATLKRMSYGQISNVPDDSKPDLAAAAVDPENPPANFATRYFIGTDTIQISQTGTVVNGAATPVGGWLSGTFSVASPADLASIAVPNTGKVTITRGANVYTVTGLPINTSVANNFSLDLSVVNLLAATNNLPVGFTYQNGDVIVSSLQIQPMELINSATGIKEFPTTYNLISGGVGYACAKNFRATGYYGPTWLQFFTGGATNITSCDPAIVNINTHPSFLFLFREINYWKNSMFPNEFRQIARPKKAIFTMPEGLSLVGVRINVNNNSNAGNLNKTILLPAPVSNGTYTLDVAQAIIDLKGGAYLDEGWEVRIYPMVQPTCKSTGSNESILIEGFMEGTFWHRFPNYQVVQFRNSPEVSIGQLAMVYNTSNNLLSASVTQANVLATTNQSKWVVQVVNASTFRKFSNVWMGQASSTAGTNIVAVQEVTDLSGTTPVGSAATGVNGVFQLGDFNTGATGSKYYLVTANYNSCDSGNISLVYGADCTGYPSAVASATCSTALPVTLNYTPVFANLQTSIVNQIAGTARPELCEQVPYEIQVNNAGIGDATSLVVTVPLPLNGGISYVPGTFELTGAFTATAGAYSAIADASVSTSATAITFTIPVANVPALKNGEKFQLKFALTTQGCTFQSGQRISFKAGGKNGCGSDIANANAASSNRITIEGSPTNVPELSITLSSAAMNLTTAGSDLTAIYNFTLKNIGDGINNYPATSAYSFNVKLPTGWVFAGNPQDLVPVAQATYVGLDPVKGYVFNFAQDLVVGAEIKIVNATMVYANATTLACDTNFGPIYESAYTTFSPVSQCTGAPCQIDQLSVDNQSTILIATKPSSPAGAATQTFCANASPTLASMVLTNVGLLNWYGSATDTAVLPLTTPLGDGQVYYVTNKLVDGSVCESDRFAVTAKVDAQPIAQAGPDQTIYAVGQFTMAGNNPTAGTGVWSEVIPTGGTAKATIANASVYNTTVTVLAGETATLRWTLTNGTCSAFDDVVLKYAQETDLSVSKIADKPTVVAGAPLTYTIKITNNGPSPLSANDVITLTETLPVALTGITYVATGGVYDPIANTFKLNGTLVSTQSVSLIINGTVSPTYLGTSILNKVSIAAPLGVTDTDPSNNSAEVTTPVTRAADLAVVKIADKASVVAGDALKYTITITNNGLSSLLSGEIIGVTETLPAGFTGLTYASTGGTYSATNSNFTLAATMDPGQSVSFTISGTVSAAFSATTIVNKVVVTNPTGITDPVPDNNTATVTTPVTRAADLSVAKIADKTTVVAGDALKYTITITNNGLSTLFAGEAIGVTETLPIGFSGLTYAATGGTYSSTNNNFVLASAMATGESVSFTISGTVAAAYSADNIVNTVAVAPPTGVTDPVLTNNTATVTTPVTRSTNLAVLKTANKTSVVAGENLVYTIKITNNGISTLLAGEAITVTETLPAGYTNLSYASTDGTYSATNHNFILASAMASGQSVSFTITGTVVADYSLTTIDNTVSVAPPTGIVDPNPDDNTATVTTPVTRVADLGVSKTASKIQVIAGDPLTYTITITNNGPSALLASEAIKVTETLPAGFSGLTYTSSGGTYNAVANTFTLAAVMTTGQSVSFTITGTVAANFTASSISNTVTVAPPTGVTDPVVGNNTATVSTPVIRIADLAIVKTANKTTVVAGEGLTYTLTITNNGQSTLFANEVIQVTESLPAALTNVVFASTNGTYSNGAFKLASDLAKGASVTINVSGTVSSATLDGTTITNVASVAVPAGVTDPVPGNNTDDEITPVTRVADLSVVKTASSMAPVMGTNFTFTIKAKNNGPSDASLVSVTDLLPSGYTYVSSNTNTGTFVNSTGVWTIGNLTNGTEVSLSITVKVLATGNYANTATVTGKETDPNLVNNTSTVVPVPVPSPPVAVNDVATTKANEAVLIPVLINDYPGLTGSPLVPNTVQVVGNPMHGTVKVNADGTVTYTPNHGYIGEDTFTYRVQDALGYWSNVATVTITILPNKLKIPNVFTPNGDGKNDTFEIIGLESYDGATITIYNRWGNEVYRNMLYKNNWDGYGLNEGTYYYIIKLKKGSKEDLYKGWVLLKH